VKDKDRARARARAAEQEQEQEPTSSYNSRGFTVTRSVCTIATPEHLKTVCKLAAKPGFETDKSSVGASPGRIHREYAGNKRRILKKQAENGKQKISKV
jgi:hypothetical protein